MRFHDFVTQFSHIKKRPGFPKGLTWKEFYTQAEEALSQSGDPFSWRQSVLELDWFETDKPYYNVWPAVFPMMSKLKMDIQCSAIECPEDVLLLRLPQEGNPLVFDGGEVKSILMGVQEVTSEPGSTELVRGLVIMLDIGEMGPMGTPIYTFKIFPLRKDMTVEEAAHSLPFHESWEMGQRVPMEVIQQAIKLCCCVCLIGKDESLVTPDILAKDQKKLANGIPLAELHERAKRRGKYGFHLGAGVESIPHYRRPHFALVWTGRGRVVPKVVMRKGAVVKRSRITEIPTGRYGND